MELRRKFFIGQLHIMIKCGTKMIMIVEGQDSRAAEMDLDSHWVIKILNVYKGYLEIYVF